MHCTRRATLRSLSRRCLHSVPTLRLRGAEEEGINGLYSASGYKTAWTDYQSHVIENLNRVAAETDYENLALVNVIAQTARQPENASVYNFAAQAFSNHFFFDALLSEQQSSLEECARLRSSIESSFISIPGFKDHFSATAEAILGSGWVWLVLDASNKLRLLSTYNAGTPFDFNRIQAADPNTGLIPSTVVGRENENALYQSMKRAYSLTPIACLSVWEHSYLPDYGVSGKKEYVDRWFKTVDWGKIQSRMEEAKPRHHF